MAVLSSIVCVVIVWTWWRLLVHTNYAASQNASNSGQWLNYEPLLSPKASFIPLVSPLSIIGMPRRIDVTEHVGLASAIATFHVELHAPAVPPVRFRLRELHGNQTTSFIHNNFLTSSNLEANDDEFLRNDFIGIEVPILAGTKQSQHDRTYGAELRLRRPLDCKADGSQLHQLVVVRDSSNSFFASQPISIVCKSAASNVPKFFSTSQLFANHDIVNPTLIAHYRQPGGDDNSGSRSLTDDSCPNIVHDVDFDDQLHTLLPTNIIYMYLTENNLVGETIGRVTAHVDDEDEFTQRNNVQYFVIGSTWPNSISIDHTSGVLTASVIFDYEKLAVVKLLVVAVNNVDETAALTKNGQRPLSEAFDLARATIKQQSARSFSYQRIVLKIENVNDNPPRFVLDPYDVAVDAAAPAGRGTMPITIIMSDDADDDAAAINCEPPIDETIYDISRSATLQLPNLLTRQIGQHPFVINSTSGELLLAQSVAQFNQSHFILQLYANQTNVALPSTSPSSSASDPPTISPLLYTLNGFRYALPSFPASSNTTTITRQVSPYSLNNTDFAFGAVTPVQVLLPVVSTSTQLNIWVYNRATQLLILEIDLPVKLSALGAPAIIPSLIARLSAALDGRLAIGRIGPHRMHVSAPTTRFRRQASADNDSNIDFSMEFSTADDDGKNYTVAEFENATQFIMVANTNLTGRSLLGSKSARVVGDQNEDDIAATAAHPFFTHNRSRTDVEVVLIIMDSVSNGHQRRYRILTARQVRRRLKKLVSTTEWQKIKTEFPAFVELSTIPDGGGIESNDTGDDDGLDNDVSRNTLLTNVAAMPDNATSVLLTTPTNWINAIRTSTLTGTPLALLIVIVALLILTLCIVCGLCCVLCSAKWRSARRKRRRATALGGMSEADSAVIAINGRSATGLDEGNSFLDGIGFVKPLYVAFNSFPTNAVPSGQHHYHHLGAPLGLKPMAGLAVLHPGGPQQQQAALNHQYAQVARRFSIAQQQQLQHHSASTTIYSVAAGQQPPPHAQLLSPAEASIIQQHQQDHGSFLYGNHDGTFLDAQNSNTSEQQSTTVQHIMLPHFEYGGGSQQHHPDLIPAPILINAYPPDYYYADPFAPMPALPPPTVQQSSTQYEEQSDTMTIGSSSSQGDISNSAVVANESLPRLNRRPGRKTSNGNSKNNHHRHSSPPQHRQYMINNGMTRRSNSGKRDAGQPHIYTHNNIRNGNDPEVERTKTFDNEEQEKDAAVKLRPPPPPPPRSE